MQGAARKDLVCGAARVYTAVVPGPKWKSWSKQLIASTRDTYVWEILEQNHVKPLQRQLRLPAGVQCGAPILTACRTEYRR